MLDCFQALHLLLVTHRENISAERSSKCSVDSLTDARTLLLALSTTYFLSIRVITDESLSYLLGLTRSPQAEAKDVAQAVSEVNSVKAARHTIRKNVDKYHSKLSVDFERMCDSLGVEASLTQLFWTSASQIKSSSTKSL